MLLPPSLGVSKATARAELISGELTRRLARKVSVEVAPTYGEHALRALRGDAHIIWAPPKLRAQLEGRCRAAFSVVHMDGRSGYHAAILVRSGRASTLSDLHGARAAWVDRESTGGYWLAIEHLREQGVDVQSFFRDQAFHGSYNAALYAVIRDEADVSCIYVASPDEASARASLDETVGSLGSMLTPIAYTRRTRPDALLVTHRTDVETAERLVHLLTSSSAPPLLLEAVNAVRFELG